MYPTAERPHLGIFVADHVRALQGLGVDVDVFAVRTTSRKSDYVAALRPLRARLAAADYDVVHAQHSYCVAQVRLLRRSVPRRVPLVFTCHEGETYAPRGEVVRERSLKRITYSKRLKRMAMGYADVLVTVERNLPASVGYSGPFTTIPPGVDTDRFAPLPADAARRRIGLPLEKKTILFPADPRRFFPKGFDVFEQALQLLPDDVHVITGGNIDPSVMPVYVNAADVVVQTSRFEASPMILKEAMACAKPIVSSAVGDAEDVLGAVPGHFVCALNAPSVAKAIVAALEGPPVTGGRERLLELGLNLAGTAKKYVDVYERAARKQRVAPGARG
jgi:glycosyltransferase involved in cell wall biosynthesis